MTNNNKTRYILQNIKTNLFFAGYVGRNKPVWVSEFDATLYEEVEALRLQKRLENQYSPAQKIVIIKKS